MRQKWNKEVRRGGGAPNDDFLSSLDSYITNGVKINPQPQPVEERKEEEPFEVPQIPLFNQVEDDSNEKYNKYDVDSNYVADDILDILEERLKKKKNKKKKKKAYLNDMLYSRDDGMNLHQQMQDNIPMMNVPNYQYPESKEILTDKNGVRYVVGQYTGKIYSTIDQSSNQESVNSITQVSVPEPEPVHEIDEEPVSDLEVIDDSYEEEESAPVDVYSIDFEFDIIDGDGYLDISDRATTITVRDSFVDSLRIDYAKLDSLRTIYKLEDTTKFIMTLVKAVATTRYPIMFIDSKGEAEFKEFLTTYKELPEDLYPRYVLDNPSRFGLEEKYLLYKINPESLNQLNIAMNHYGTDSESLLRYLIGILVVCADRINGFNPGSDVLSTSDISRDKYEIMVSTENVVLASFRDKNMEMLNTIRSFDEITNIKYELLDCVIDDEEDDYCMSEEEVAAFFQNELPGDPVIQNGEPVKVNTTEVVKDFVVPVQPEGKENN